MSDESRIDTSTESGLGFTVYSLIRRRLDKIWHIKDMVPWCATDWDTSVAESGGPTVINDADARRLALSLSYG